jgi:rod shape-determining protein MreD
MRKVLLFASVGFLFLAVQALWQQLFALRAGPEFVFLLVIFSGVRHRFFGGLLLAFVFGYFVDALWGLLPGLYPILYAATFAACRLAGRRFYLRSFVFQLLIAAVATLAAKTAQAGILAAADVGRGSFFDVLAPAWRSVLWNTLLALPVMALLERLEKPFAEEYANQFLVRRGIL